MAEISQTRAVSGFDRIILRHYGDIFLVQGDEERLAITTEEEMLPILISEVRDGALHLYQDRNWLEWITLPHYPIRYDLFVKSLKEVSISGSGSMQAGRLQSDALELGISGAGKVQVSELDLAGLEVKIGGSADLHLAGKAVDQRIRISGSAQIDARDLLSKSVDLRISGSGEAWVFAEESLRVDISGSGKVHFKGNPRLSQKVSGSAEIEPVREISRG